MPDLVDSSASTKSQTPDVKKLIFTPIVISGAIIDNYEEDGYTKFSFVCSHCGYIDKTGGWNRFSQIADIYTTPYGCPECSKITNVEIHGIYTED